MRFPSDPAGVTRGTVGRLRARQTGRNKSVWDVAGANDFQVAEAIYQAAISCWPTVRIMLQQDDRVVHDTGERLAH